MDLALTRDVSPQINNCELTYIDRQPIDYRRALAQHQAYCRLLEALGLEVLRLPADPVCPDCCFVEDAVVALDELAIVTNPGTATRRAEIPVVERAVAAHRKVARMSPPATLEGGDVLRVGRTLFVGETRRTTAAGIEFLRKTVTPLGYSVVPMEVRGCLHLKSAVTDIDDETLLANVIWIDPKAFPGLEVLPIPLKEPWAANVLRVRGQVVVHSGFPLTIELLEKRGVAVRTVDVSEFLKAEAGVTCKSVLFRRM